MADISLERELFTATFETSLLIHRDPPVYLFSVWRHIMKLKSVKIKDYFLRFQIKRQT